VGGESVVDATQRLRAAVDLPGAIGGRALEHHVLEEMGDAAVAGRLVAGAGAVEQGRGHQGGLTVLDQADGQAVAQLFEPQPAGQGGGPGQLVAGAARSRAKRSSRAADH
jgi:hypothetical protein